jgi:hypothetical protein
LADEGAVIGMARALGNWILGKKMVGQGVPEYGLIVVLFAIGIFGVLHAVI